jgi:hypothetical protein
MTGQFLLSAPDITNSVFLGILSFETAAKPLHNSSFDILFSTSSSSRGAIDPSFDHHQLLA